MSNDRSIDFTEFGELIVKLSKINGISITHGMSSKVNVSSDKAFNLSPSVNSVYVKVYRKKDDYNIIDFEIDKKPFGKDLIKLSRVSDPLRDSEIYMLTCESKKELMESSNKAFKLISDFLYEYLKSEVSGE